jgi:hypothetical protein
LVWLNSRMNMFACRDWHVYILMGLSRDLNAALKKIFCLSPFNSVANTSQGLGLQVQKYR